MKFKKLFTLLFVLAMSISSQAQIPVFADYSKGDSTSKAIDDLATQLAKAGIKEIQRLPLSAYKGQGVLLLQKKQANQYHISYPAALNNYGAEGIYIKGTTSSITIIGNSQTALQPACYFYLEQLGYRYLMPGKLWEEIPKITTPFKNFTVLVQPDFEYREIANGHGYYNMTNVSDDYKAWARANKFGGAFTINIGHAYDEIVGANLEVFKEHPEYFAQKVKKGEIPGSPKFNVANGQFIKWLVETIFKWLDNTQTKGETINMLSLEMSDGPGYCTSPECLAIGGSSEQAFYLSNAVLRETRKRFPKTWVGLLAYSEHILPPKFPVEPNTFVMVTGAYNPTSFSTQQLISMWSKKVSKVGIYDYIGVYEWDNDLPGQINGAKSKAVQQNIQSYYKSGARAYLAESTMGWVGRGLGQYLISKLLWDRNANVNELRADFFKQAFGNVAPIMQKLYDNWENYPYKIAMENDMGNWLDWITEASARASTPIIRERINDVKMYIHYVALYRRLKMEPNEKNLLAVMEFAYRNIAHPAFATLPTLESLPTAVGLPQLALYGGETAKYSTRKDPSTNREIDEAIRNDLATIHRTPEVHSYQQSGDLVRLANLPLKAQSEFPQTGHAYWGNSNFVISIKSQGPQNYFEMSSGFVQKTGGFPVTVNITQYNPAGQPGNEPLLRFEQEVKNKKEQFSLASLKPGIYLVQVYDDMKMFTFVVPPVVGFSVIIQPIQQLTTTSAANLNTFYFYVPSGTKNFRVAKSGVLKLKSPTGRAFDYANEKEQVFNISVNPGEEGLWTMYYQAGSIFIDGIPPYFGTNISQMLAPSYLKNQ